MLEEDKNALKEAHGSGLISTLVFLAAAICIMIDLRYFLNYKVLRCYARRHLVSFQKLKVEGCFKVVGSCTCMYGAFPLLGGGLGWGLTRKGRKIK